MIVRLAEGSQLGRYRIRRRLGAGAMGEVYLAEDPQIGRDLAIKTVLVEEGKAQEIEERKRRLLREARAAGKLLHPNIVALFDAGEDQGLLYLAFEFVDGMDLADRIVEGPPLSLAEALSIVRQTAEALDYAHRQGVVHRDIKPSNLMVTPDGRVKVADFGIAKVLDQTSDLTMTGSVVGSPHYLSPEQIRGDDLDGRTDIFSLGVLLYEILCRRRPFEADTLTTLVYQILHQEPKPVAELRPELGPRLERLVRRMMHKDRDQRFSTAGELASEIAACERELAPEMLARRAQPDEPTDLTVRLPEEAVTAASTPPLPPTAAMPGPLPPPPPQPAVAPPPRSRLGLFLVAGITIIVALVALGVGARRWVAGRKAPAASVESAKSVARPAGGAETTSKGGGDAATPAPAAPEPKASEAAPVESAPAMGAGSELAFQPGERPVPRRQSAVEASQPPDPATARLAPPAASEPAAGERAAPGRVNPPAARVAEPVPDTPVEEPAPEAPPLHPARDALVERIPVDREIQTGMSLSFELEPRKAAERIVVRFDRIVIGRAGDWDASRRGGRAYAVPEQGLHILTFLVDGSEVYRVRIDARPGGPAPTRIQVTLPQFAGRR